LWRCGNHIYKDSSSAPTCAKPAPHARPTAPANNSGDKFSRGSDSESSEAAFLPGSGKDEDGASSGSDVDVILSGDDSVIKVSAPDCPKEKSKGKKKRSKGRKSKGKAKVQLQAAIATIPDAEKEPETDEVELGVYFKVDLLYPSHDKPLIAWLQKKWTMVSSIWLSRLVTTMDAVITASPASDHTATMSSNASSVVQMLTTPVAWESTWRHAGAMESSLQPRKQGLLKHLSNFLHTGKITNFVSNKNIVTYSTIPLQKHEVQWVVFKLS
jgi:hypothetical protein